MVIHMKNYNGNIYEESGNMYEGGIYMKKDMIIYMYDMIWRYDVWHDM